MGYTDEEAKEILRRAIERHEAERDGFARDDLVEAARELGIPPELVERAEIEVRAHAGLEGRKKERRRRERQRFGGKLATYAVVNAFLAILDYMTGGGWWVQWPLLIWGFLLVLQLVSLVHPASVEKRDNRAERRYQQKLARDARRRAKADAKRHRRSAEAEFEAAVERGVAALLSVAAKSLDGIVNKPAAKRDRRRDFEDYVARQRGEGERARAPAPSSPRARVSVEADAEAPHEVEEEDRRVTSRRSRSPT